MCSWYDIKSYGPLNKSTRAPQLTREQRRSSKKTTYHDGSRYHVHILCTDELNILPNNHFSAIIQIKSLQRRLGKDQNLDEQYSPTIRDNLSKSYVVEVENSTCFKTEQPREWYLPHHTNFHPHKPGNVRGVLNGLSGFIAIR